MVGIPVFREAFTRYLVVHADWTAGQLLNLVIEHQPSHIIVQESARHPLFLFRRNQVFSSLEQVSSKDLALRQALHLATREPAHCVDAYSASSAAPDRAVLFDGEDIVGVFDRRSLERPSPHRDTSSIPSQYVLRTSPLGSITRGEVCALTVFCEASPQGAHLTKNSLIESSYLDLRLEVTAGLEVVGLPDRQLVITTVKPVAPVQFKVKATTIGPARLEVLAFQDGYLVAWLPITLDVTASPSPNMESIATVDMIKQPMAVLPDLTLNIYEERLNAFDYELRLHLFSRKFGCNYDEYQVRIIEPRRLAEQHLRDIEKFESYSPEDVRLHLEAKGEDLFTTLFPQDVQKLLWREQDRISTILIQSKEPWIPWELCKLCVKDGQEVRVVKFLCEKFAMTRWFLGMPLQQNLRFTNIGLVIPEDSGLTHVADERQDILSLAAIGRVVTPIKPRLSSLVSALAQGTYDGWHFAAHNRFASDAPDLSAMYLEGGGIFRPENLSGLTNNLGRTHPLVFLNSCQSARSELSLTHLGGWASRFIRAGAGAFIGSHWRITDQLSRNFANTFYRLFLAGVPIGEAIRQSRLTIRALAPTDPTWIGYTVYADPQAVLIST